MTFSELQLIEPILKAVEAEKYLTPSPIQREAIPHLLAGKDVFGCAQTGTGKTAAFALPIIQKLYGERRTGGGRRHPQPRALVLAPTRELATQIADSFKVYSRFAGLKTIAVFGGVSQRPQVMALRNGIDVLVATPGRLVDLMRQKLCDLRHISTFVLDEADHMLDLGFIHDVKFIISKVPAERQTLMFSATMPEEIRSLAASVLRDPTHVAVAPVSSAVETVSQSLYHVEKGNKSRLLIALLRRAEMKATLIFSRTKHGADKICKMLKNAEIRAHAIHGDKSQAARQDAMAQFKKGKISVLVATDIAARGIDVRDLSHVVNYDLPDVPETYVHCIGRTGRAGRNGVAIAFCDPEERGNLRDIERLIKTPIPVAQSAEFSLATPVAAGRNQPARSYQNKPRRDNQSSWNRNSSAPRSDRRAWVSNEERPFKKHGAGKDAKRSHKQYGNSAGKRSHGESANFHAHGARRSRKPAPAAR